MKVKELIDHCNNTPSYDCIECEHDKECERFKEKFGSIPDSMDEKLVQFLTRFNYEEHKEEEI